MATYQKGAKFITKLMVKGVRYSQMTDTAEEGEAWELEARAALKRGLPVPKLRGVTVGGRDAGTMSNVLRSAKALRWERLTDSRKSIQNAERFVNWVGPTTAPTDAFTPAKIRSFVEYLIAERKVKNKTLNRYMSALSVLAKHSDLPEKPELPWFKEEGGRKRFFSPVEEQAAIRLMDQWGWDDYRDLFMFLIDTGLRPWKEATRLTWKNVKDDKITVQGKSQKWRDVPLTKRAQAILERQPHDEAGPFTRIKTFTAEDKWELVRNHIPGMSDTVWYTARHTFASRLVQEGVSLKRVAVLMDNSAAVVDKTYAHLAPDHLADAVASLEKYGQPLKVVNT